RPLPPRAAAADFLRLDDRGRGLFRYGHDAVLAGLRPMPRLPATRRSFCPAPHIALLHSGHGATVAVVDRIPFLPTVWIAMCHASEVSDPRGVAPRSI